MQHAQQVAANCRAFDFCALILQLLSCIWGAGTEMARLVHDQHQQNVLVCTSNIKNCLLPEQLMLHYVIVKTVVLVGLIGMHKTGCSGETRLVLHAPSSS